MSEDEAERWQPSEALGMALRERAAVTRVKVRPKPGRADKTVTLKLQLGGKDGPSLQYKMYGVPRDHVPDSQTLDGLWSAMLDKVLELSPKERKP